MPKETGKILVWGVSRVSRTGRRRRGRCRLVEGSAAPSQYRDICAPVRRRGARAGVVRGRRNVQPCRRSGDDIHEMLVGEKHSENAFILFHFSTRQCQHQAKIVPGFRDCWNQQGGCHGAGSERGGRTKVVHAEPRGNIYIFFFFNLLFLSYLYVLILSLVYMIYFFPYSTSSILINSQFMHDMMCDW